MADPVRHWADFTLKERLRSEAGAEGNKNQGWAARVRLLLTPTAGPAPGAPGRPADPGRARGA